MSSRRLLHLPITLVVAVVLAACASSPSPAIPSGFRDGSSTLRVMALTAQTELKGQFVPSTAAGKGGAILGGAVGMLIGSGIDRAENRNLAKAAELEIQPYKTLLDGFGFHDRFAEEVRQEIGNAGWGDGVYVSDLVDQEGFKEKAYAAKVDEDYVLVLKAEYSLSPEHDLVNVGVFLTLFDKRAQTESSVSVPIADQTYIQYQSRRLNPEFRAQTADELALKVAAIDKEYEQKMAAAKTSLRRFYNKERDRELNRVYAGTVTLDPPAVKETWDGESLKREIARGISEISRLVVMHLNDQRTTEDYDALEVKVPMVDVLGKLDWSGGTAYEFAESEGARVYRTAEGELYVVPTVGVLTKRSGLL